MLANSFLKFPPIHLHYYAWNRPASVPGVHYGLRSCSNEPLLRRTIEQVIRKSLEWPEPAAPAGYNRGTLYSVLNQSVQADLTAGERDAFYERGINPIRHVPGHGLVLWGAQFITNDGQQADIIERALPGDPKRSNIHPEFLATAGWEAIVKLPYTVSSDKILEVKQWLLSNAHDQYLLQESQIMYQYDEHDVIAMFQSQRDAVNFKLFFYY